MCRFWRGLFCRFENGVHPREILEDVVLATVDHSSSLEDHINFLQKVSFDKKLLLETVVTTSAAFISELHFNNPCKNIITENKRGKTACYKLYG